MGKEFKSLHGTALGESEARLGAAIERLKKAAGLQAELRKRARALERENGVLEKGLAQLKMDYEGLEKAFNKLKDKYEGLANEAKDRTKNAEGQDIVEVTTERDSLKGELKQSREERETLERSFALLKEQYLQLQKAHDTLNRQVQEAAEGDTGSAVVAASAGSSDAFRAALASRLDDAITRIERLSAE